MSGWGLEPWGLGPWGLGITPVAISYAFAAGDRFVRVKLTAAPLEAASTVVGSVFNPKTWTIQTPSTGRVLTVLSVAKAEALTYDILTLEQFDDHYVTMAVGTDALKDATGAPVGLLTFGYKGVRLEKTSTPQKRVTSRGFALKDVANPPTPNSPVGGTLEITSNGDYKSVEGPALLKKLILRRLCSAPGDFFHLPEYGIGLRQKEPLPVNDLVMLKKQIEMQIAMEPDVETTKVRLAYDYAASALLVGMQVKMTTTGQQIEYALPIPTGAVQV